MTIRYGGFRRRLCACLLDTLILLCISMVLIFPFFILFVLAGDNDFKLIGGLFFVIYCVIYVILSILYYPLLHSSKAQGTWGMRLLKMRIYTDDGKRVSFWRAVGRLFVASFVSGSTTAWIGYLMIIFTKRKQALHDFSAETVVVVTPSLSTDIGKKLKKIYDTEMGTWPIKQ